MLCLVFVVLAWCVDRAKASSNHGHQFVIALVVDPPFKVHADAGKTLSHCDFSERADLS